MSNGNRARIRAQSGEQMLAQRTAIKDAVRNPLGKKMSYRKIANEEDRIVQIFLGMQRAGTVKHTDAVNIRRSDYGEIDLPSARPWIEKGKRVESVGKVVGSMVVSKNVTEFAIDMIHLKDGRVVDLDPQLTNLFDSGEVEACLLRQDFHNRKDTIVKKGVSSMVTSGIFMGAGTAVYLSTVGNIHTLIEQASNLFLSGPRFGQAIAIFAGAEMMRALSAIRINRRWDRRADANAVAIAGPEATASMLLKTEAAVEIRKEERHRAGTGSKNSGVSRLSKYAGKILGTQSQIDKRIKAIYEYEHEQAS